MSSIVPYENYPDFSPELLYLQELGVYKAVYPRNLFFSEFAEDFCNSIVKRISAYELRTTNNGTQNSRVRMHKNKIYAPALHELIHYRKLPPQLLDYFGDRRYIHDYNTDGWMEIDSKIAQIYMRTLAEYSIKCSGKDIVLGTDTSTHSREIYNNSRNRADLQAQCCKINIENCLPQPSMDVSFEDILEFKNRRKDEPASQKHPAAAKMAQQLLFCGRPAPKKNAFCGGKGPAQKAEKPACLLLQQFSLLDVFIDVHCLI